MSSGRQLGIGVIGLGRVSSAHLDAYVATPAARLVAVCDTDTAKADEVASSLGARPYSDAEKLFRDPEVDAVTVLLPHRLHFPIARAALEAGKHVSVEKPFTVTEAEAAELIALARERSLTVASLENTKFVIAYLELERLLREGALGEIRSMRGYIAGSAIEEYLDDTAPWKREAFGAGTIMDTSPHMLYLAKWLFGDVVSIQTIARNWMKGIEVDDHAIQVGELACGALFSFEYCLVAEYPWTERVEVYGSEGSLIIDQLLDPPAVIYRGENDVKGTPLEGVPYNMSGWKSDSMRLVVEDFVDAALSGRDPGVKLDDARYVQRLLECSYRSAEAGGALVEVGPASWAEA